MRQLWDYLDGDLPPDRLQELADHIAVCKRCYPQFRFEFAFLEALARQRTRLPDPADALVQRLRVLLTT
ncbi:MAG: zf-HC2 domain-containing protein [Gemmatimonadales bacterium]